MNKKKCTRKPHQTINLQQQTFSPHNFSFNSLEKFKENKKFNSFTEKKEIQSF